MTEFDLLGGASVTMQRQRMLLDVAARNVAAAQASRPGQDYARLVADVSGAPSRNDDLDTVGDAGFSGESPGLDDDDTDDGSDAAATAYDTVPSLRTHTERGSADALTEMMAVIDAQRSYEQSASIFDLGKRLAERTIDVGRS